MEKMTIKDYMKMVKALREMGQALVEQQYNECDEEATWVSELEIMETHLECCERELKRCGV